MPRQAPTLTSRNGIVKTKRRGSAFSSQAHPKQSMATLAIIGFTWGGWVTGSSNRVGAASECRLTFEALTPVGVDKFYRASDAPARLLE